MERIISLMVIGRIAAATLVRLIVLACRRLSFRLAVVLSTVGLLVGDFHRHVTFREGRASESSRDLGITGPQGRAVVVRPRKLRRAQMDACRRLSFGAGQCLPTGQSSLRVETKAA